MPERRRPSNLRSLDGTLRRLRAAGRLDDGMGEAFATAARTCAIEVDAACTPTSDVPSYARGRVLGPYLRALEALAEHVRPVEATDPWAEWLARAAADLDAEEERARQCREDEGDASSWDAMSRAVDEAEPGTFPLTG